jgi:uncharacterized protein (DUF1778 family)
MKKSRKTTAALRKAISSVSTTTAARSERLGLRSSEAQLMVLRRAADVAHKSLTDFILDSACLAAEQTLLDQRLFMASSKDYQAFLDLLDRPARSNAGLKDLFSRQAPWDRAERAVQAKPAARKAAAKKPAHA